MVTIRTQLTVALLAVTQLRRKHAASADADRLLAYVVTALARITREVRTVDALMTRLEDREAIRADPLRLRARRRSGEEQRRPEHGEPVPRGLERPGYHSPTG
ncbi:MAG: hypothetical protein ACYDAR_02500 [Thermomicrobiales bacterium]